MADENFRPSVRLTLSQQTITIGQVVPQGQSKYCVMFGISRKPNRQYFHHRTIVRSFSRRVRVATGQTALRLTFLN